MYKILCGLYNEHEACGAVDSPACTITVNDFSSSPDSESNKPEESSDLTAPSLAPFTSDDLSEPISGVETDDLSSEIEQTGTSRMICKC